MKKNILFLSLLLSFSAFAGNPVKTVKTSIKEATVFLKRAQLKSTASAAIEAGYTDIVLDELSSYIEPQSIQISGKGDFIIMSVKHQMNYVDPLAKSKEVIALEDSVDIYRQTINKLMSQKDVLLKEEQFLLANQSVKGTNSNITPEGLKGMIDFFRDRLTSIKTELLKTDRNIEKTTKRKQLLESQLNVLRSSGNTNRPSSQILVTVSSKSSQNVFLNIDYIINEAGWYPLYDIRAKDSKGPVQLNYKAQVYQNSGVNWDNVKLKLSTMNPSLGGTKPELNAMYLNIYEPVQYKMKKSAAYRSAPAPAKEEEMKMDANVSYDEMSVSKNVAEYTTTVETTLAAEFDIAIPYSIESNIEGKLVDVQSSELAASYIYSAAPKIDNDAFLLAQVTGWESLNMLSGNANIYFEGTYVGESYLDMQNTKDTLNLSLGRDKKVVIERKSLKEYTSKKLIGTNRKEEFAYEIAVRNTKKDPVEIILEDQYPVSQNSQIEVELIDAGGAEKNESTGKLVWKLKINPAETKKVVFKYSVKYPKGKSVSGL